MRTASLDHDCPREQISVVDSGTTTVVLMVCGERRVYRDIGDERTVLWTDVTNTTR